MHSFANLETIDCFTSWDIGNEGRIATYEDDFENVFGKSSAVITLYEAISIKRGDCSKLSF